MTNIRTGHADSSREHFEILILSIQYSFTLSDAVELVHCVFVRRDIPRFSRLGMTNMIEEDRVIADIHEYIGQFDLYI